MNRQRHKTPVIGVDIDVLGWISVLGRIEQWSQGHESRYVCLCNVHAAVTATRDEKFRNAVADADLVLPDGAPIAWMLRQLGAITQPKISGPDLMWEYLAAEELKKGRIYLYGGCEQSLHLLCDRIQKSFPLVQIVGAYSPPFRELTTQEDEDAVKALNQTAPDVVFVGLGCPKQELWMAAHRGRVQAVMIGVGAAFDYHAQTLRRAPLWMQNCGFEWLYRLVVEPRRLWKRYLVTNSVFLLRAGDQWLRSRLSGIRPASSKISIH